MAFDLVIRGGTVVTAEKTLRADIGINGETIAAVQPGLAGERTIDATGRLVMPGGIDSHCHVEQLSSTGKMCADDFYSATVAAAFGGTTTIIPFAAQHRGHSIVEVVDDYARRAAEKAVIDYGFHLIIGDPTDQVLNEDLPGGDQGGLTSFKVYMTYPK
jgi:dihydropyrimidinase